MKFTVCIPVEVTDPVIVSDLIKRGAQGWGEITPAITSYIDSDEIAIDEPRRGHYDIRDIQFSTFKEADDFRRAVIEDLLNEAAEEDEIEEAAHAPITLN